jgi:hypothetical protein
LKFLNSKEPTHTKESLNCERGINNGLNPLKFTSIPHFDEIAGM